MPSWLSHRSWKGPTQDAEAQQEVAGDCLLCFPLVSREYKSKAELSKLPNIYARYTVLMMVFFNASGVWEGKHLFPGMVLTSSNTFYKSLAKVVFFSSELFNGHYLYLIFIKDFLNSCDGLKTVTNCYTLSICRRSLVFFKSGWPWVCLIHRMWLK